MRGLTGVKAISAANRENPPSSRTTPSMPGATWYIEDVQPSMIYRVCTSTGRVTTILLPPGERFNGAVGGNVDAFLINVAYAGPRPAVSILPRVAGARGNLQLVTTAGFYSYSLGGVRDGAQPRGRGAEGRGAGPHPGLAAARGRLHAPDARPPRRPAAGLGAGQGVGDSRKMVVRFHGPLPVLPTLLAG